MARIRQAVQPERGNDETSSKPRTITPAANPSQDAHDRKVDVERQQLQLRILESPWCLTHEHLVQKLGEASANSTHKLRLIHKAAYAPGCEDSWPQFLELLDQGRQSRLQKRLGVLKSAKHSDKRAIAKVERNLEETKPTHINEDFQFAYITLTTKTPGEGEDLMDDDIEEDQSEDDLSSAGSRNTSESPVRKPPPKDRPPAVASSLSPAAATRAGYKPPTPNNRRAASVPVPQRQPRNNMTASTEVDVNSATDITKKPPPRVPGTKSGDFTTPIAKRTRQHLADGSNAKTDHHLHGNKRQRREPRTPSPSTPSGPSLPDTEGSGWYTDDRQDDDGIFAGGDEDAAMGQAGAPSSDSSGPSTPAANDDAAAAPGISKTTDPVSRHNLPRDSLLEDEQDHSIERGRHADSPVTHDNDTLAWLLTPKGIAQAAGDRMDESSFSLTAPSPAPSLPFTASRKETSDKGTSLRLRQRPSLPDDLSLQRQLDRLQRTFKDLQEKFRSKDAETTELRAKLAQAEQAHKPTSNPNVIIPPELSNKIPDPQYDDGWNMHTSQIQRLRTAINDYAASASVAREGTPALAITRTPPSPNSQPLHQPSASINSIRSEDFDALDAMELRIKERQKSSRPLSRQYKQLANRVAEEVANVKADLAEIKPVSEYITSRLDAMDADNSRRPKIVLQGLAEFLVTETASIEKATGRMQEASAALEDCLRKLKEAKGDTAARTAEYTETRSRMQKCLAAMMERLNRPTSLDGDEQEDQPNGDDDTSALGS